MAFIEGMMMVSGNLNENIKDKVSALLILIDVEIRTQTQQKGIPPKFVALLNPLNTAVFLTDNEVYIVATDLGRTGAIRYIDLQGKTLNIDTAIMIAERELLFTNTTGFSFSKKTLELNDGDKKLNAKLIAENYLNEILLKIEKLKNIVRINPIFHGRDFQLNDKLIFMLSPFSDQFNTIFIDHIKPTAEKIDGIKCRRADNIYDNKPIIEDIWKSIHEAVIIISELTGRNPNVFYETGIAHTVGKEVILITQNLDDVPFDLRHLRCIVYDYTPRGIQLLENNLTITINNIRSRQRSTVDNK